MAPSFREALDSGKFVVTAEITPPKGITVDGMLGKIDLLKDKVDALNVPDNQSSVMRLNPLAVCHLIRERGGEVILQLSCRDRNRLALQSDLLGAYVLGIHNVLCLTGDHVTLGDHKEAKPVFDIDSVQLLQAIKLLEEGNDLGGNKLEGGAQFCSGATVVPGADPLEPQLLKFEKKIKAGATFFQTQAIYDLEKLKNFMKHARQFKVKVLAGVTLLDSSAMVEEMSNRIPGISMPRILGQLERP